MSQYYLEQLLSHQRVRPETRAVFYALLRGCSNPDWLCDSVARQVSRVGAARHYQNFARVVGGQGCVCGRVACSAKAVVSANDPTDETRIRLPPMRTLPEVRDFEAEALNDEISRWIRDFLLYRMSCPLREPANHGDS